MNEYTPEKVAELVAEAWKAYADDRIAHWVAEGGLGGLADALIAVSAELRQERDRAALLEEWGADIINERTQAEAERDRLHKAITEALEAHAPGRTPDTWVMYDDPVWRILRAALDKEGNDDE